MSKRSTKNGTSQSCFRWWTLQSSRRLCSAEMLFTLWGARISPEPHKPCHFRRLKWFYNAWHATQALQTLQGVRWEGSWMRAVAVFAIWCSFCPALNLNGFAANTEPHQTCDETSPIDTFRALLWLHPATTTYSTSWCVLEPLSRKKVWTLVARRLLGLTRFSAVLPWRLGLTDANLEESTSCIPSCYGPSWHLHTFAKLTPEVQWSHNLQNHLDALDAVVLSGPGRLRRGNTSLHITKWCRFLNVVWLSDSPGWCYAIP